jgi:hypothetical protein
MTQIRVALAASALLCAAIAWAEAPLVKYSYTGPTFTLIEGDVPPWTSESRITGYLIVEKLPPSTTIDFLDPDFDYPFPNLPKTFSFTDGARTITQDNIEDRMFNTRLRERPSMHEVRSFWVRTNEAGDIVAWDLLLVSHVLENTFLSIFDGQDHGQDQTEVQKDDFGCTAEVECRANVNYTSSGPKFRGTVYAGGWEKEMVDASAGLKSDPGPQMVSGGDQ